MTARSPFEIFQATRALIKDAGDQVAVDPRTRNPVRRNTVDVEDDTAQIRKPLDNNFEGSCLARRAILEMLEQLQRETSAETKYGQGLVTRAALAVATLIITNAGRAALVNAAHDGTGPTRIAQVGISATAAVPSVTAVALPNEIKRLATISGDTVSSEMIHLIARDETADAYVIRSFALYLSDGTLFAIYGQADPILDKTSAAIGLLAIDVALADINAAQLTFGDASFIDPPATETRQGVVQLAADADALAMVDRLKALTPAGLGKVFTAAKILSQLMTVDGAGSGLDADLLDGQHGSYYADIPSRLGFTPLRQGGGAGQQSNVVYIGWDGIRLKAQVDVSDQGAIWTAATDGAGSGLDADLLDGLDSSQFVRADNDRWALSAEGWQRFLFARGGATYVKVINTVRFQNTANVDVATIDESGSINCGGDLTLTRTYDAWGYILRPNVVGYKYLAFAASGGAPLDQINANTVLFTRAGNRLWDAGNDGSGSGLDADMLDGRHASDFALAQSFAGSLAGNGYQTLPSGLVIQWGFIPNLTNQQVTTFNFPTPFPNAGLSIVATLGTAFALNGNHIGLGADVVSRQQGKIAVASDSPGTIGANWIAIGF